MADHNRPSKLQMDEESEWEYEYHKTETEDFHITLDLSSHSKPFGQGVNQPSDVTAGQRSTPLVPSPPTLNPPQDKDAGEAPPSIQPEPSITAPDSTPVESQQLKSIQILDLHTRNPLISYNSQLYSCEWTSTIGTDMLFAAVQPEPFLPPASSSRKPPPPSQPAAPILPSASLLAATRIKLSARPVQVIPRADSISSVTNYAAPTPAHTANEGRTAVAPGATDPTGSTATPTTTTPLIPLGPAPTIDRQNQAAFLTRLINIKRAKGETDEVTVYAGQRDARRGVVGGIDGNEEGEDEEGDDDFSTPIGNIAGVTSRRARRSPAKRARGRGRASKRRGRPRRVSSGAGLFRDYQPSVLDGEVPTVQKTPRRWEDLGADDGLDPERDSRGPELQEIEGGSEGAADWRQRLSEHLQGSGSFVVAANDGFGYGEGAGAIGDEGEDIEMGDA